MKSPIELVDSIYLGDRACKSILVDGWNERIAICVDVISRIRSTSGNWEYYTEEDIENGLLVFTDTKRIAIFPEGEIPNDQINYLEVERINTDDDVQQLYRFRLSIDSVCSDALSEECVVEIVAGGIHLEDPREPGAAIRE